MAPHVPAAVLRKVRKLAQLPQEARHSRFAISITRLTVLKSLCQEPEAANRFVTYLARKTLERVKQGKARSGHPGTAKDMAHRRLMTEALAAMEAWRQEPTEERRPPLVELLGRMRAEQNEYKNIPWGSVRLIHDWDLLLFENALSCLLQPARVAGTWAYQMARDYAERYDGRHGTGLIPASAPLVQDIVDFWMQEYGLDAESLTAPATATKVKEERSTTKSGKGSKGKRPKARFTHRQGQYLAFIHAYRQLHREGPAELDLVQYFRVTPPAVHSMLVRLEKLELVTREPGVPRSVRVAIPEAEIPALDKV